MSSGDSRLNVPRACSWPQGSRLFNDEAEARSKSKNIQNRATSARQKSYQFHSYHPPRSRVPSHQQQCNNLPVQQHIDRFSYHWETESHIPISSSFSIEFQTRYHKRRVLVKPISRETDLSLRIRRWSRKNHGIPLDRKLLRLKRFGSKWWSKIIWCNSSYSYYAEISTRCSRYNMLKQKKELVRLIISNRTRSCLHSFDFHSLSMPPSVRLFSSFFFLLGLQALLKLPLPSLPRRPTPCNRS